MIFQCFLWNIFPEIKIPCALRLSLRHCSKLSSTMALKIKDLLPHILHIFLKQIVCVFFYTYPPVSKICSLKWSPVFVVLSVPPEKKIGILPRPGQDRCLQNPFSNHPSSVILFFEETRYWQRCVARNIVQVMYSWKYSGKERHSRASTF